MQAQYNCIGLRSERNRMYNSYKPYTISSIHFLKCTSKSPGGRKERPERAVKEEYRPDQKIRLKFLKCLIRIYHKHLHRNG